MSCKIRKNLKLNEWLVLRVWEVNKLIRWGGRNTLLFSKFGLGEEAVRRRGLSSRDRLPTHITFSLNLNPWQLFTKTVVVI